MWQTGQNGEKHEDGTNMTKFYKSDKHYNTWKAVTKCGKYDKTWQTWQNVTNVAKHGK